MAHQQRKGLRLGPMIREILARQKQQPDALTEDISCGLCADEQWWEDNGFSPAERYAFCGPSGLDCPGIEPPPGEAN